MMDWMNEWVIGGLAAFGVLALMVAFVAWQRGKNAGLWLLLSLLLTPILSLLLLLRITRPKVTQDDSHLWVEFESDSPDLGLKCSACRIPIRTYTRVCFHCGSERDPSILEDGPHRQWCNGVAEEKPVAVSPAREPVAPSVE